MAGLLTYELLALDPTKKTRCENAPSLLYMLRGFSALWKSPKVVEDEFQIIDGETTLHVGYVKAPCDGQDGAPDISFGRAFVVTLSGPFDAIEPLREPLTGHLKDQQFQFLYVLRDEISQEIACKLYPCLYRLENQLRGYLMKFMSTRIGPTWWEVTVPAEISEKIKIRKKNERVFGKHVDTNVYLIDFDELGEIIYEQCSGFVTKDDIIRRIKSLPETPEAIKEFKQDLQTNYQKLFKESFADKEFREKWQEFEALRNKIAHGNLFTRHDLERGERLTGEITELVAAADKQTEDLIITQEERKAIQVSVITQKEREAVHASDIEGVSSWNDSPEDPFFPFFEGGTRGSSWKDITEEEFLRQLKDQEAYFHPGGGFVGLSHFVRDYLGRLGYGFRASYEMVARLQERRIVEVYTVPNPWADHGTSAIRSLQEHATAEALEADRHAEP